MKKASSVQMVHNVVEGGRFYMTKRKRTPTVSGVKLVGERR